MENETTYMVHELKFQYQYSVIFFYS